MPVIILAGDEEFELKRRLNSLKKSLLDPFWAVVNFLSLSYASVPEIIEAAASLPFGPGNRLVVVESCDLFTKKRSGSSTASDTESSAQKERTSKTSKDGGELAEFEHALANVASNTYLLLSCPYNFDTTLKFSKVAEKHAQIEHFTKEKFFPGSNNSKLEHWCRKEAKQLGITIDDQAIRYLLEAAEANLRQVASELTKAALASYPKTHVTYDLVCQLSPHRSHVFALADRWLNGETAQALASLKELLAQENPIPVIATLQTLLSKWIKLKVVAHTINEALPSGPGIQRKELPLGELSRRVATQLKQAPFMVERDLKRLHHWTTQDLVAKRQTLVRLEYLVKIGQMPGEHALESLLLG